MKNLKNKIISNTPHFKKVSAFTLIELLIAVTISSLLFVSVLIFVSSSMRQNIIQEKVLKSLTQKWDFSDEFTQVLWKTSSIVWSGSISGGTGIILRQRGDVPFALLSTESFTGLCDSYSGSENASGSGIRLVLKTYLSPSSHTGSLWFTLSQTGNIVFSGGTRIIGTWSPWNWLTGSWETTELHFPSALYWTGNTLYVADTFNHRILAYDIPSKNIAELLGQSDGINLPVDIVFSGSSLLIANAGDGKILSYQDSEGIDTEFTREFYVSRPFTFNSFSLEPDSGALSAPTNTGSYVFSRFTPLVGDTAIAGTGLTYVFSWSQNTFTGTLYKMSVTGIVWAPTTPWSHRMKISFLSGWTLVYQDYFPWYTVGDGKLETSTGNVLKILESDIDFPHNLQLGSWARNVDYSSFIATVPLQTYISTFPIRNFSYSIVDNILTLHWEEYSYYDCLTEKHKVQERVYKQYLK
jgi:hypothetical protein